jgi:predicted aldo/keto reductase-like oxidoreductase
MEQTESLVMEAVNRGVNYFDTAYIYPGSEEALGKILEKNGARDRVFIATKLPLVLCRRPGDFDTFFNKQLERLRTGYVDYYLMHMLTGKDQWERLCGWGIREWIAEKKRTGAIRQLGFSFHGSRQGFLDILESYDWDFCQIQYNYSNEHFQAGVTGLRAAAARGIPVMIMEPLLGGKLAGGLPPKAAAVFRASGTERSPAAWGLRWVWDQEEVSLLLSGMSTRGQLEENLTLAETAQPGLITEEEREVYRRVVGVLNESYRIHCTGCNYCMPCPRNVNIPGVFAAYNSSYSMGYILGMQQYSTSAAPFAARTGSPWNCVKCGKCETLCPQHIPIIASLGKACQRLEPFWMHWAFSAARIFLGNHRPSPGAGK